MKRLQRSALLQMLPVVSLILAIAAPVLAEESVKTPETIVLISLDTVRADRFSCYGYEHETTPIIDALASESLFFEDAFAPVPMTLPSHSSIFTGLIPPSHGVHVNTENSLPALARTLPEILQQHGYTTYGNVSAVVLESDRGVGQGFDTYDDAIDSGAGEIALSNHPHAMRNGRETTDRAIRWLNDHAEEKKFMFIHYFDPHAHYTPPPPFDARFEDPYDGEIAFTDHCVGEILTRLKALGLYDDALIALVGDHGELLGEHEEDYHSFFIYQNVLRVPMMFKLPGSHPPKRVKDSTSLIDVAQTILSLANLDAPKAMQGVDLSQYLRPGFSLPDRSIYVESMTPTAYNCSSLLGLIQGRWHYIQSTRPELYDRFKDPAERNNLIEQHPDQALNMKKQLKQIIADATPLDNDTSDDLDAETLEQLESLGYVTGDVAVDYSFEQGEYDAKDMIGVANRIHEASRMAKSGQGNRALDICAAIIEKHPKAIEAYKILVEIHLDLGDFDGAQEVLFQMRSRFPDEWLVLFKLAETHILRKDYPNAVATLNAYMALKDDDVKAYRMLVDAYTKQKDFDNVIATLQRKRFIFPDDLEMLITLGRAYEEINNLPKALVSYNDALSFNTDSSVAHTRLGHIYFKMGEMGRALNHFERTLALDANVPDIHGMVAFIKVDRTNPQLYDPRSALDHAKTAFALSKDKITGECNSPIAYETLAFTWAANGGLDQAIVAAQRAVELYHRGNLPDRANNMQQRLDAYQNAKQRMSESRPR
jgi:arylsulfatase A-like enzyme